MQVKLEPISLEEFLIYSELAFHGDVDMQTKYGTIKPYETPAQRNVINVKESNALYDLKFYVVVLEDEDKHQEGPPEEWTGEVTPIGFTVSMKVGKEILLYSFGINIEYRKGDILKAWLDELDKVLGKNYKVPLFLKNTRAIKFFTKNGFGNTKIEEENKGILMWR